MSIKNNAQDAIAKTINTEAWWYEDRASIHIFMRRDGQITSCKIHRRHLKDWIERTEKKPG